MHITMIVNPHAGKKRGLVEAEKAASKLKEKGYEVNMLISRKPGDSITLSETLETGSTDAVLAIGGDGTLFEVINGLLRKNEKIEIPLGQIPVGTGNSFIKDLGINSLEDAVNAVIRGNTGDVDLGRFTSEGESYYFINLLGSGFVSNVAYRAKKYKIFGSFSYIFGVLEEVAVLKSVPIELEIDGTLIKREAIFTEICNSRYTGGDMMMAPDAEIDDGLLDVILMKKTSRMKLLSLFPSIFKGTHIEDDCIEVFKGKKITLKTERPLLLTPDGETFGSTPLTAEILKGKLRMYR